MSLPDGAPPAPLPPGKAADERREADRRRADRRAHQRGDQRGDRYRDRHHDRRVSDPVAAAQSPMSASQFDAEWAAAAAAADSEIGGIDGVDSAGRRGHGYLRHDAAGAGGSDARNDAGSDAGSGARNGARDAVVEGALSRIVRTYVAARAAVGVALVVAMGATSVVGARVSSAALLVCVLYAVQAAMLWLLPRFQALTQPQALNAQRRRQWVVTIGADLAAFSLLHLLEHGATFNFAALFVLPVLMSGVLTPRLLALGTSAAVALLLLGTSWGASISSGEGVIAVAQSGLGGIGLFVIALLAGELAGRLAREEIAARGSMQLARQQAQLNRLVIEEMADGVLVVDERLRVRAANPAARALLSSQGLAPAAPFQLQARPAWLALGTSVELALAERSWPDDGRDVALSFGDGQTRTLRMRVRFTRRVTVEPGRPPNEDFCVLLLEDVRTAQARLRQEKLAAMGRVSAGIAHEIRNPLAAISQANALMLEDEMPASQQQLARMIADNVHRLKRIVDDVLEAAPGVGAEPREVDARAVVRLTVDEWAQTADVALGVGASAGARLRVDLPQAALAISFDPEHLRRILVNLLDNALRHSSARPDAVLLRLAVRDEQTAVLSVASDGAPITADVERHLFEPFFSTRSRGSGLGLYICRELCERYGASIEYRPRAASERHRNGFIVVLRRWLPQASTSVGPPLSNTSPDRSPIAPT
jgi:two-component system, NtrC family, sensor histidine kinase PilS